MAAFQHIEDVFGQMSFLKSYTHLLVLLPIEHQASQERVAQILTEASEKVVNSFPWLAGKVVNEGIGPEDTGTFRVHVCNKWSTPNTIIRVRELYDRSPTYAEILKALGPSPMIEGRDLAPCVAFPQSYAESQDEAAPVAAIQANFITGGLLLDFAAQHNIVDGSGIAQWTRMFCKALRGEKFSTQDIEQGNRDRRNMIKLLGPSEPPLDHKFLRRPKIANSVQRGQLRPPNTWRYFRFTADKLAQLKTEASHTKNLIASVDFISTNDALSAFCWKRLVASRLRRKSMKAGKNSKFFRAVDARRALGVPHEYMGHMPLR